MLLYHFCFCLGCMDILTGPALICDVFCCLFNLFFAQTLLLICCCCVSAKIARAEFCRLVEFCDAVGSCLLLVKLFACIMRVLVHVLCSHCSSFDFFGDE